VAWGAPAAVLPAGVVVVVGGGGRRFFSFASDDGFCNGFLNSRTKPYL